MAYADPCARRKRTGSWPVAASRTRTPGPSPPDASHLPSGENITEKEYPSCPWSASRSRPVAASQTWTPPSLPHVASFDLEKDQDLYPSTTLGHITALRDLLMILPKAAEIPANKDYKPPQPAGDKQP